MIRLGLSCFPAILSPISSTCQIRKQSYKKFLSLNPKYLGGPGGPLCQTQVNEYFRAVRPRAGVKYVFVLVLVLKYKYFRVLVLVLVLGF